MSLNANLVPGLLKVTTYISIIYANTNHVIVLFVSFVHGPRR